jgi:hypothetical protein
MALPHRRIGFAIGGAAAAVAGALIAWGLVNSHRGEPAAPPPASVGGLVIDSSGAKVGRIDAARPLRCFVAGRLVGELSLADCARRNGVATEALDVGADQTGALAAGQMAGPAITPLPPIAPQAAPSAPAAPTTANAAPTGACWRYDGEGQWRKLPSDTTLNGCVQALFAGRCERPGGATYGRWMQQTLRLVPGRIEVSADNHSFRTLVEQGAGCAIPAAGG